jgi:hypothetical protein
MKLLLLLRQKQYLVKPVHKSIKVIRDRHGLKCVRISLTFEKIERTDKRECYETASSA